MGLQPFEPGERGGRARRWRGAASAVTLCTRHRLEEGVDRDRRPRRGRRRRSAGRGSIRRDSRRTSRRRGSPANTAPALRIRGEQRLGIGDGEREMLGGVEHWRSRPPRRASSARMIRAFASAAAAMARRGQGGELRIRPPSRPHRRAQPRSVTRSTCAAASCSAWLSRSAATRRGIGAVVGDHQQFARARPACRSPGRREARRHRSWPRRPRHCPARKSWRRAGCRRRRRPSAAIAWAPPIVQIAVDPANIRGQRDDRDRARLRGRGGVTTTISRTPAARAGMASISRVEKSGVLPPGHVEADPVDRPPDLADDRGPAWSRPHVRRAGWPCGRR